MQTALCGHLPTAFAGRQIVAQRQARVQTLAAPASRARGLVVRAQEREAQGLTGEWSANWSLASCELPPEQPTMPCPCVQMLQDSQSCGVRVKHDASEPSIPHDLSDRSCFASCLARAAGS